MLNKSIYMGRLVADPELKRKRGGEKEIVWCPFRIAVQRDYRKGGVAQADYITCIAYGSRARYIAEYGKKAYKILVEGRTETGSYEGEYGQKVYVSQLVVTAAWILEYRPASERQEPDRERSPRREPAFGYAGAEERHPMEEGMPEPDIDMEIPEEVYFPYEPETEDIMAIL